MGVRNQKFFARSLRALRSRHTAIEGLELRRMLAAHIVGSSTVYSTIQAAVTAATAGATITVDAGSYAESVTVNKSLTIKGAQSGVDARSDARTGSSESICTGATSGGTNSYAFRIAANDVTLDGFIVQNESNGSVSTGAGIVINPSISGTHIVNNIIQNNCTGIYLSNASATDAALIQHNVISNNNNGANANNNGGRGIYTDGSLTGGTLQDVTIDGNFFTHNFGPSATPYEAAIGIEGGTSATQTNINITNNVFDVNGKAVLVLNGSHILIDSNVVANHYDTDSASLRFEGNDHFVTITHNTLYANGAHAIRIDAKGTPGSDDNFTIENNNIYDDGLEETGIAVEMVNGEYSGTLDATNNYWGSTNGPGGDFSGSGNGVTTDGVSVTVSPWLTTYAVNPEIPYYGLAQPVIGTINAVDFDHGLDGTAYHDTTVGNDPNEYRSNLDVDMDTTTDAGKGFAVVETAAGEWLRYSVNVATAGIYTLNARVQSTTAGAKYHIEIDGATVSGAITIPVSASWQTVQTPGISLPSGTHVLRLVLDTNNSGGNVGNWNWFNFTLTAAAPTTPTNLAATATGASSIGLSWTDASPSLTQSFDIERSTDGGLTYTFLASTPVGTTTYTDSTLSAGTTNFYKVRADNTAGNSAYSSSASATTTSGAITYLSDLTWASSTNGWGPVEKDKSNGGSNAGDGTTITLNGVTYSKGLGTNSVSQIVYTLNKGYTTFLTDIGMDDETGPGSVEFEVFLDNSTTPAYDSGVMLQATATKSISLNVTNVTTLTLFVGNGGDDTVDDHADWANARLQAVLPAPSAPSNVVAIPASQTQMNLTWQDNSNNETGFKVERSLDGSTNWTLLATTAANVTTYSDSTGLSAGTTYYYRVRATNAGNDSANSAVANASTVQATTAQFIAPGSVWKYLDNGTNQGTAWVATGFVDSAWKSGPAQLGYGDGDEATVVSYGSNANNKYITTYFRQSFTVADASRISAMTLQLIRDDGAVVYLNGTEVYRNNISGTVTYTTLADTNISGTDESTWYSSSVSTLPLVNGTNVIAVEMHQSVANSSDISFDFQLAATVAAPAAPTAPTNLTATGAGASQINLVWTDTSSNETRFIIDRSLDGSTNWTPIATPAANSNSYTDTSVASGRQYFYRIRATDVSTDSANSPTAHSWPLAGTPATPSPNGAVFTTAAPILLDWADSINATSYDVYIGSTFLANVTASQLTNFTPAADGVIQWHVIAKNADNSATGPTWSFTVDTTPPTATLGSQTPTVAASTFDFTVTYADATTAVDATTFDSNDVTVTGPNSFSANATFVSTVGNVVTYRINAPGGTWDLADNGLYTVTQSANQIKDTAGNARATGTIGTFNSNVAFAWANGSNLNVQFDNTTTPITLGMSGANLTATMGSSTLTFSGIVSVAATGTSAANTLQINGSIPQTLTLTDAAGNDSVRVMSGTYTFASDVSPSLHNVSVIVDPGANAIFSASQHLTALTVNGHATLATGGAVDMVTNSLTIAGSLNLQNNQLFVNASGDVGAWNSTSYAGITGYIQSGRNGGTWDGNGLTTGMSNAKSPSYLTTLGVAKAGDILGITSTQTAVWNGETVNGSTVLVKYTYTGDANLNGIINGDDYFLIDSGFTARAKACAAGDFDYNGTVNADDYFLIDANYNKAQSVINSPAPALAMAESTPTAKLNADTFVVSPAGITSADIASAYDQLIKPDDIVA